MEMYRILSNNDYTQNNIDHINFDTISKQFIITSHTDI